MRSSIFCVNERQFRDIKEQKWNISGCKIITLQHYKLCSLKTLKNEQKEFELNTNSR